MASTLIIMDSANLFVGDEDPTNSKHLAIEEVKLPDLQGKFAEHTPGGSPVGIEIQVGIEKLEPTFKLKGFDPDLMARFGYGSQTRMTFTIYGNMVNLRTGEQQDGIAIINGRLDKVAPDSFKRGDAMSHDYAINEVMRYELHLGGEELVFWDFFEARWRTKYSDNSIQRRNIRIPS